VGLFAGLVFLHGPAGRRLSGPWAIWLLLLLLATYTSGIEWMRNHMGPGCLLAGSWFLAALTRLWAVDRLRGSTQLSSVTWTGAALTVSVIGLLYAGLGLVWMPVNPLPRDAYRYVEEIEREFMDIPPDKVLLDVGAWIHARNRIVTKDQAPG